jgi:hypothetical protein
MKYLVDTNILLRSVVIGEYDKQNLGLEAGGEVLRSRG